MTGVVDPGGIIDTGGSRGVTLMRQSALEVM